MIAAQQALNSSAWLTYTFLFILAQWPTPQQLSEDPDLKHLVDLFNGGEAQDIALYDLIMALSNNSSNSSEAPAASTQ